jgi:MFS family permease
MLIVNGDACQTMTEDDQQKDEERQRYRELLGELRTIIPGVQVLFAFLLTVPFSSRFAQVDPVGKAVFTVSLMAVAAATILLLGPAAYHRLADRQDRRRRLRYGVRLTLASLALLALSMACAVFVVGRFLFDDTRMGAGLAAAVAVTAAVIWYVMPGIRRWRSGGVSER